MLEVYMVVACIALLPVILFYGAILIGRTVREDDDRWHQEQDRRRGR